MSNGPNKDMGSGFLYVEDLLANGAWFETSLTISESFAPGELKASDKKPINKYVIGFAETNKRYVVPKTCKRLIHIATGQGDHTAWVGQKVTLYPACGEAFGKKTPFIRVRCKTDMIPYGVRKHLGSDLTGKKA